MIAVEVSKILMTEKLILIASAKTFKEIPFYFRLAGKLNLHKLIPATLLKQQNFIMDWFFGIETEPEKRLLREILLDTDTEFLKWSINSIMNWRNETIPESLTHIHGSADRILPNRFIKADFIVNGGGHFMTVNKSLEINALLKTIL